MTAATDKRAAGKAALRELLKPVQGRILVGQIIGAASAAVSIAPYVALVKLGEVLLAAYTAKVAPDASQVRTILAWLIGTFLLQLALLAVALGVTHFADLKLNTILREQILARISRAPLSWFSEATSGRVRKAVQDDTRALHQLVAHAPVETVVATITPVMLVGYAFSIDWRLGLLTIATLPIYIGIALFTMRDMGVKTAQMDTHLGQVSATAVEFADGIAVVKAFGRTGQAHSRFRDAARAFTSFYEAWVGPILRISAISESTIAVPVLVLVNIAGGGALAMSGVVSPVEVLTCTLIALVVPGTIQVLGNATWSYQLAGNAALRIQETRNGPELTADVPHNKEAAIPADASVEFRNVSFSYGDTRALTDVSLQLTPGTVTALVGPSGSGKSTLATMVARFQDPTAGVVLIGGVDIRQIAPDLLYRTVSFVLQDPQLPRISIRENIRLARPEASDEEVLAAARDAQIATDIAALPAGLDTVIGEDGQLSGGQRQRIAIARAILANTPILVLDEATAATDPDCEAEIQIALNRLVAGRTVLVIGHKPESVRGADQIVLLRDSRIVCTLVGEEVSAAAVNELMSIRHHDHESDHGPSNVQNTAAGADREASSGQAATDMPDREPVAGLNPEHKPEPEPSSEGGPAAAPLPPTDLAGKAPTNV